MAKTTGKNLRTTRFSFRRMALYGVALALALLIASAVMGAVLAVRDMRDRADVSLTNAKARIESSVAESFKLLESLAEQPTLYERSVWVMDKVTMLDQVNEHFGYFLLCYVDDEMNVWDVTGSAKRMRSETPQCGDRDRLRRVRVDRRCAGRLLGRLRL